MDENGALQKFFDYGILGVFMVLFIIAAIKVFRLWREDISSLNQSKTKEIESLRKELDETRKAKDKESQEIIKKLIDKAGSHT